MFLLVWLVQFLKERHDKSKFSWLALLFKHFFIKILSYMNEQKRNDKKSMICFTLKPSKKKNSEIILLHQTQTLNPLIMLYEAF